MFAGHQSIDIPLASLANDKATFKLGAAVEDPASDSQPQIPSTPNCKPPQAEINYNDGSDALFSLFNEKTMEFDSKHIENWREDANSLMILSGLVSAAVSGFLAQSYFSFQTNSQDVSAFYLSQIYQLQLSLNGTTSSPIPAPPIPVNEPASSHVFWFASLVTSFVCAVGATVVQEWIRRFQLLTQLRSSPHRRSAHIRTSISRYRFLEIMPAYLKVCNMLLHTSIYLFLVGLTFLPLYFDDWPTFGVAIVIFVLALVAYGIVVSAWFFHPRSFYFFPLLLIYCRDLISYRPYYFPFLRWPTLLWAARKIGDDASTHSSTLDTDAMSWLLDSLTDEEDFERFVAGIPGFYKSTQVKDPAKVLQQPNTDRSPKVILSFIDRSLSSDLPEETRQRRIEASLKAMRAHPYLLQRSFHHALQACFTESAIFKTVDFVHLTDQHANDDDANIRSLARCIITIAINRLEDYHVDEHWARIIQRRLDWPENVFHQHREQRDSIKLRNLIQLVRELNTLRLDSDTFTPEVLGHLLREVCKLNVRNVAPKLQNEFCDLWNELVIVAQIPDQDSALVSHIMLILSLIRTVHVSLHHQTESQPPSSSAKINDLDPDIQYPSSYSPCTASHDLVRVDTSAKSDYECLYRP